MMHLKVSIGLMLATCFLATPDSIVAQTEPETSLEMSLEMRRQLAKLDEAGRQGDAAVVRIELNNALRQSEFQLQLQRTLREIEELTAATNSLASKLETGVTPEDAKHIERELMRLRNALDAKKAQLRSLHEQQRHGEGEQVELDSRSEFKHGELNYGELDRARHEPREIHANLEHLHLALKHLHAAGMHELAEQVLQRAHQLELELETREQHRSQQRKQAIVERIDVIARELNELRDEVRQFRD